MTQPQHRHEPAEREDPRNVLLDTMAQQIVDMLESAVENEVIEPLLARIDGAVPALAKRLALLKEAAAAADALVAPGTLVAPSDCPAGSRPLGAGMAPRASVDHELRLTKVLAALQIGKPKTDAARDLLDGAKMVVLSDLAALRAARSVISSRKETTRLAAGSAQAESPDAKQGFGFSFVISDVGGGE